MNRRYRVWPAILLMTVLLLGTATRAAGPSYSDPLGRFTISIQPGWSLNPVYPDSSTVEFLKSRDHFRVRTIARTRQDVPAEAQGFLASEGVDAVPQQPGKDGSVRAAYASRGTNVLIQVACTDKTVFVLQYSSPGAVNRSLFDEWVVGFKFEPGAPFGPDPAMWDVAPPVLHRDPRGRFNFSHPSFWVLTALNSTNGDATYTTRFEELGGAGYFAISTYPGVMGDLRKHMTGWVEALSRDPKYPDLKASGEPQLMSLGGAPVALGSADYGAEGSRRGLKLMLATYRGTNCSVVLDYKGDGAQNMDARLWALIKSMRF